jgi:hypothetical protein
MRSTLALTATVLTLAWAAPASAQMCGGSPSTTGATASTPTSGGMMCGMGQRAAATDPMSETRSPSQQSAQGGMGCPCCRQMAMMPGGMRGMMGGGQQGQQEGSQPSQPSTPAQPSMPGMPGMTPRQ